jgi:hypothetical protein
MTPWPDAAQAISKKYVDKVLIPVVTATRNLDRCANKPAILFCDNGSAHCSENVLKSLFDTASVLLLIRLIDRTYFKCSMFFVQNPEAHQDLPAQARDITKTGRSCPAVISGIRTSSHEHNNQGSLA